MNTKSEKIYLKWLMIESRLMIMKKQNFVQEGLKKILKTNYSNNIFQKFAISLL